MLTTTQLEARTRGLGASDAHVLLGLDGPGKRTWLSLWTKKRRGRDLEVKPMAEPEHDDDDAAHWGEMFDPGVSPMDVGNAFESSVVKLYEIKMRRELEADGAVVIPHATFQHPDYPWARANPDRVIARVDLDALGGLGSQTLLRGLEGKMVGRWAVDRWEGGGLPGYVSAQCQWSMWCSGLDRWDACAWICGTEARVIPVYRDDALIKVLKDLGEHFWETYILGDTPPPAQDGADLVNFLGRRFPKDNGEMLDLEGEADAEALALVKEYKGLTAELKALKALKEEAKAKLADLTQDSRGIQGKGWRFTYPGIPGSISWKKVAEELAGGAVDDETIEKHRGAGHRHPTVTLSEDKRPWRKKK